MRTLDILVPVYNEPDDVVKPLLDSLAVQQSVDFNRIGVIICCDGGTCNPLTWAKDKYPFKIEYYMCEHKGVSATRNACLDKSKAKYVMFCDCDDMFFNACGLYIVFREIDGSGFDSLVSSFVEETRDPKDKSNVLYINHSMDSTFVHGKVHKRKYLIKNNIRWNENLTIHEDSYFNCLCQKLSKDVKFCPTAFYLWKWRDQSICRHDPKYILKTYNNMLDSNTALINEFIARSKNNEARFFVVSMVTDAFFTLNKDEWVHQDNQEYRAAVELRFSKYWHEFKHIYNKATKEEKLMVSSNIRQRFYAEGLLNEHITFDDWIKTIEELYKG